MGTIRRGWDFVRAGFAELTDLALPAECAGCGGAGGRAEARGEVASGGVAPSGPLRDNVLRLGSSSVCSGCAVALAGPPFPVRRERGSGRGNLPVVYALAPYREPVSELIIAQKEHGRLDLARPLGRGLAAAVAAALADSAVSLADLVGGDDTAQTTQMAASSPPRVLLVPIPSSKAAERRRGQDPVFRMARAAAAGLRRRGVSVGVLRALRHNRVVADQVGLSRQARAANLAGSMSVTAAGRRVLSGQAFVAVLLDDVYTSGATLAEAARALRTAPGFGGSGSRLAAAVLAGPVR
jgi:predicted amidophosphoribosyltransferase